MKVITPMQITATDSIGRTITGRIVTFEETGNASVGKVTIRPVMVRPIESVAVICIGVITFIATCPLLLVFHRSTLHRFDSGFHTLARVQMDCRVGNRLDQT